MYGDFGLVLGGGLGEEDVEGHGALVDGRGVGILCEESSKVLALRDQGESHLELVFLE